MYLIAEITKIIPYQRITNKAEIIISGSRVTARVPDLIVLTPEGVAELSAYRRSTIILDMPPPLLVIEVVSPGKKNRDRDYRAVQGTRLLLSATTWTHSRPQRSEYAARGIAHYWIIDTQEQKFICLELKDGLYEESVFNNTKKEIYLTLPFALEIDLTKIFLE